MLAFKALSTVFRELKAPELEAAQEEVARLKEELANVRAKLEEAEDEIRFNSMVLQDVCKRRDQEAYRRVRLESENKRLQERADGLMENVREGIRENLELRDKLYKRRRKDSANALA